MPITHRAKTVLHQASPGHFLRRANTTKVVRELAEQLGLVYFGFVDQTDDDHRLVRGMTVSSTHGDHHYTVGTFKRYDISLLVRRDTLVYSDKRVKDHYWTIVTADLHTELPLPHMYIGHHTTRELMIAKYSTLTAMPFGINDPALVKFNGSYSIYGSLEHEYAIATLLPPPLLVLFDQHSSGMSVEIVDNTVHVYLPEKHPTKPVLEKMLNFAIWMAQSLDTTAHEYEQRFGPIESRQPS